MPTNKDREAVIEAYGIQGNDLAAVDAMFDEPDQTADPMLETE